MALGTMTRRPLLLLALLAVALANQLEDIPHNEVKNWALKFGVDLWEFGRHFTKMNQIQNKYREYNVEVNRKDGLILVRELAAEVKNHMDFKINAVMRIMDSAEAAALSAGSSSTDGSPGSYYDARWLNVHADDGTLAARARRLLLSPSRHFDHIAVNTSYSAVLMPPYINTEDGEVQNQIAWSEHLDPLFVNNYEIDPTLSWQYYASSTGFMRRYPAMSWPPEDGYSHHARDFYDFRSSNWFVEAATSPKDLVILLDDSDDLGSSYRRLAKATVSALLDTLGPNDFVNVYKYNDSVNELHPCYTKILAQAVPETIRELKSALWASEASGGAANLTGALTTAFAILQRYNRTGQGCQCNQAIAVVGAGGGAGGVKAVFRTWNWPHMPVRIFTYRVGGDAASGHNMMDMACTNKGFHVTINDHGEIRGKVLHFMEVLARPMVMYQTIHPVHWSPVYVGRRSSSLDDDGMGQLMTSVSVPIFDRRNRTQREANLLGVVGTDVPVDQIKKLVPPYKLGVNGYSFMVDNNGHVLYHPDLRPLHTNEEYTETLRPLYSSVDITDVELLVDSEDNSRVNLTSLLLDLRHDMIEQREGETEMGVKVQYDGMRRVSTRRQRYFYSPVDGTPYSLAAVLPDGYGMYELQAEQEIKHSPINVTEYFKGDNWKIHPDWVYCEYASTSEQTFTSAEEQLVHFLTRTGRPGWKWMSLRPRALTLHNAHKKQDRDAYYCDKTLVQSLVRDAMVIKELDAHTGHTSHHSHKMPFKIVETTENGKSLLTTVPAQWEQRGILYWPRKNEAILIKAEDSTPEINWKSMPCILKRNNIHNYESSEQQIALMSDMSDTDTDQEIITKTQRPKKSSTQINLNDLVTKCLSENTSNVELVDKNASFDISPHSSQVFGVFELPYDQATETTGIPGMGAEKLDSIAQKLDLLISIASAHKVNIQVLFDHQQNILQKLALLDTKLEELVTRISIPVADINRQSNNDNNFKIISNLQELTSFEERLNNLQAEENIIKLLSLTCTKGKGRAYNNAYALVDAMFTRKFMTQCSWAGGTRGEPKICFKSFTKTISLFFKIIHQSDNSFTIPECELFLKNVMRHSNKRNESKLLRASAQKNRQKKSKVLQESNRQSVEEQCDVQNVELANTPHQKENASPLDLTS